MYWAILLLFLILLFLLSMRKEGLENSPRTMPIKGPVDADIYNPRFKYPRRKKCKPKHPRPGAQPEPQPEPEPEPQPVPEDDGTHRSDTATKQYSIYFYKPFATLPFPTSPPPQPYLNDFKVFQR
jgi:hypothetical protein